jgi:hypothetical protein
LQISGAASDTSIYPAKVQKDIVMTEPVVDALILDLLLATRDRSYEEVMDAWRTSCPKLPVWEEANDRGLVASEEAGGRTLVRVTSSGRVFLEQRGSLRGKRPNISASSI